MKKANQEKVAPSDIKKGIQKDASVLGLIAFEVLRLSKGHLAGNTIFAESADIPASAILVEADREMLKEKRFHRKAAHERIKQWIEQNMDVVVSIEDDRY